MDEIVNVIGSVADYAGLTSDEAEICRALEGGGTQVPKICVATDFAEPKVRALLNGLCEKNVIVRAGRSRAVYSLAMAPQATVETPHAAVEKAAVETPHAAAAQLMLPAPARLIALPAPMAAPATEPAMQAPAARKIKRGYKTSFVEKVGKVRSALELMHEGGIGALGETAGIPYATARKALERLEEDGAATSRGRSPIIYTAVHQAEPPARPPEAQLAPPVSEKITIAGAKDEAVEPPVFARDRELQAIGMMLDVIELQPEEVDAVYRSLVKLGGMGREADVMSEVMAMAENAKYADRVGAVLEQLVGLKLASHSERTGRYNALLPVGYIESYLRKAAGKVDELNGIIGYMNGAVDKLNGGISGLQSEKSRLEKKKAEIASDTDDYVKYRKKVLADIAAVEKTRRWRLRRSAATRSAQARSARK